MYKGIILSIISLLLLFMACKKDELTLPAKVLFKFELVAHEEADNLKSGPPFLLPFGKMRIDSGSLEIGSIEFDGRRDEGKDVFFVSDFPGPVKVDLSTGKTSRELSFDIPQGIYNRVELYLTLGGNETPSLVLEGKLGKSPMEQIPLRFEYDLPEQIKIRAEGGRQSNRIVLRKDTHSTATIKIDAGSLFQFANLNAIQNAEISSISEENIVIISAGSNANLFNSIANRLERSFRVIIE